MKKILFSILSLTIMAVSAYPQLYSTTLPLDNVMNSQNLRCIAQDKNGFLWMGSNSGLFQYDGYRYQKVEPLQNRELMPNNAVQNIINWGSRYLWIRLRGELYSCYDIENDCFVDWYNGKDKINPYRRYTVVDDKNIWFYDPRNGCCHVSVDEEGTFTNKRFSVDDKSLPSNQVNFIIPERENIIWIGTTKGLVRVKGTKSSVVVRDNNITCAEKLENGLICFVSETGYVYQTHKSGSINIITPNNPVPYKVRNVAREGNTLVLGTESITYCYDIINRNLSPHPYIHISGAQMVYDNMGNKVVFDRNGTELWYITPQKTYHLTNIYNSELTRQNGGGRFKFIYGNDGNIYISTYGNGLFIYNTTTNMMSHHSSKNGGNKLVGSDYLINILEDRVGHIWLCQENLGIRVIGMVNHPAHYYYFTDVEDFSHANTIRLIEPIGDKLYVGNYQNMFWTMNSTLDVVDKQNLYADDVVAAAVDKAGRIWTGTRNSGIFVNGKPLSPSIKGKVSDILCDRQGRIWISIFDGGLYMVMPGDQENSEIRSFFLRDDVISQPRSMIEDHNGKIWLCSNAGVYVFSPDKLLANPKAFQHINVSGTNSYSDEVHCVYEDSQGRIWAGTAGYGVVLLNSNGEVVRFYTDKDGLPNNNIESIIEDKQGNLWVGTGYGMGKYVSKADRFYSLFLSNNTLGLIYTEGCAKLLSDGRLAMGTLHGMQVFDPNDVKPSANVFPLMLTDVLVNGTSLRYLTEDAGLFQRYLRNAELKLSHDQNSLTFYFSTFEYLTSGIVKYSFFLEGFDDQWSEPQSSNSARYKNLRPGKYILHVRSYSPEGIQNEHEVTLNITISHPWWNTWWAWLLYLLFIAVVLWTFWRHYTQVSALKNKIALETQLTDYKLRFFTNISHEFRTPLTIIRGAMDRIGSQSNIPGDLRQPISSMQKSTDRLLRLVNELLEFRKIQNHKLRLQLEETEIIDYLRSIFLTFSETAENHRIDYQFTSFARQYKMFIDRNFVDKMAYNLLSNAFKYTPRGKSITMRIKKDEDGLLMEVEDTGIGIAKEKQGDLFTRFNQSAFTRESIGIGLHMVSELVRVHHGKIAFRENPEGGSIFSISLPTDKTVYAEEDFLHDAGLPGQQDSGTTKAAVSTYKEVAVPPMNDYEILIVDDDDDIREYLNNELRRYFSISQAMNGAEALEQIKEKRPALIVSDVKMPVINGFELIKRIRQDQELADIPVILLTALSDEEKMIKGTEYGADAYIPKPFNINFLVAKCRSLIVQRDKLRVRYAKEVVGQNPLPDIIVEDVDKKFLERFDSWIYSNISNSDMQFMDFANIMKMGRTTFFKKVRQVTGMAPHEYIRKARLTRAAELLSDPTSSISEVAYQTGFEDPNYFSRTFKTYFGITATQFKKGKRPDTNPDGTPPVEES
ncbi:MAG: response regulator [Prevotella sp.]|nr:response regulator [Prevotella sp.]